MILIITTVLVSSYGLMAVFYILHEQIHWSLLITGFFLADEPPEIPYPANHYRTKSELAIAIATQVLAFFNTVEDESNDKWSPQVVETLYWWFGRWGYTYLFASEAIAGEPSAVPGGGDWRGLAFWAVTRMRKDIEGWAGEREVVSQVIPHTSRLILKIITTLRTFSKVGRLRHGFLISRMFLLILSH
jgi:hypothetical protein